MNQELSKQANAYYGKAERKAADYWAALSALAESRTYVSALTEDMDAWKRDHVQRYSWLRFISSGRRKRDARDYRRYIQRLNRAGKLDRYLDRSVTYLYMRDLGKAIDRPDTQRRIGRMAASIKQSLLQSAESGDAGGATLMNMAELYRWAQKEGVENAAIWVIEKLKNVASHIPEGMDAEQSRRKLMKIIAGVVLHAMEELDPGISAAERALRLDEAIRLGYAYGLTYPFIDDLLDSQVLDEQAKAQYSRMLHDALLTGKAPRIDLSDGGANETMAFIHAELQEAFEYMLAHQRPETKAAFFEHSYVLYRSQEADRAKVMSHAGYTNEELYIPVILKSASSRLIVRAAIGAPAEEDFDRHTFYYGIYNQLADDFADLFDDLREGAVTPYTYYLTYRGERPDLINPYELYWAVIYHLIHRVYRSDAKAREVILDRAINGLKRAKARLGDAKYAELMAIFAAGMPEFDRLVQRMVRQADDVDFLDKLLRDEIVAELRNERRDKEEFVRLIETVRREINETLRIDKPAAASTIKEPLIDAANYSLEGDGKRLRPILTWVMGVREYGLQPQAISPLLKSLEYMHTASLIFDDLPSQDNASTRRGRPTLHQVYNSATAELTGLFLIQKAIQEQSSMDGFDARTVLALMHYSAERAGDLCMGQAMDLDSKGKTLTLEQLNMLCYYKTGIAFEAALVMPAILARAHESEIAGLKAFAYHAGIAFQIKDDLLDLEGCEQTIGKSVGKDAENNSSTFVSVLGRDEAKKAMWNHYCLALDALKELPRNTAFLKHFLSYLIMRER